HGVIFRKFQKREVVHQIGKRLSQKLLFKVDKVSLHILVTHPRKYLSGNDKQKRITFQVQRIGVQVKLGTSVITQQPYLEKSLPVGSHTPSGRWLQAFRMENIKIRYAAFMRQVNRLVEVIKGFKKRYITLLHEKSLVIQ